MPVLNVTFTNNSGFDADAVSIGFFGGPSSVGHFAITKSGSNEPLQALDVGTSYPFAGNWYSLHDLASGVVINSFSGRIYVAYGPPWAVVRPGYTPAQAVNDPNFFLRYDKFEITFTGDPADVANLTSIDYWSIPMTLNTSLKGKLAVPVQGLLGDATAQSIYTALHALTTPPVSGVPGPGGIDGVPLPALVPGQFQQYPTGPAPGTNFARIIGPSSYPPINPSPGGIPVMPYDTFDGYLQYLLKQFGPGTSVGAVVPTLGDGVIATIAGEFHGVGPNVPPSGPQSAQRYSLSARIGPDQSITLSGQLTGIGNSGDRGNVTMVFVRSDLMNPTGIYGGNSPFSLNGATTLTYPANDVYGWIGGDLFAGVNIGAVGSTTIYGQKMVGELKSSEWFKTPQELHFGGMQSDKRHYNQWASTLTRLSQAYNFAYTDRFAKVFASLNPANVDTLHVTLEPARITM